MRLRTVEDFIDIACSTPESTPVGLTWREIHDLEIMTGNRIRPGGVNTLIGRRIVAIPWDWERKW